MLNIVILAAGMGKRMCSKLPKVLQPLASEPLLGHVLKNAKALAGENRVIVVVGHGAEAVKTYLKENKEIIFAHQDQQLGTGHALMQALPYCERMAPTLVLLGDVPLIETSTLEKLCHKATQGLGLLTVKLENPKGYGRIIRSADQVLGIVEEKDATEEQRKIDEVNTGIMVLPTQHLSRWLSSLSNKNAQGEYYLTDVIAKAVEESIPVVTVEASSADEVQGVNSKSQLADLERVYQKKQAYRLMQEGVTLIDPERFDLRGELICGKDVEIDVGCIFSGRVVIGNGVRIGAYCVLQDVEIGQASKVNHLSYIGDTDMGERVNIGAGTITCNYDGVNKFRTTIEDDAFIGSDTQLVAPVRVGKGATLGAGTTLTKDAPDDELTLSRARQTTVRGWKRPTKK